MKYEFYNLFATSMIIACCYSGFLFWSDNLSLHHAKFPSIITRALPKSSLITSELCYDTRPNAVIQISSMEKCVAIVDTLAG